MKPRPARGKTRDSTGGKRGVRREQTGLGKEGAGGRGSGTTESEPGLTLTQREPAEQSGCIANCRMAWHGMVWSSCPFSPCLPSPSSQRGSFFPPSSLPVDGDNNNKPKICPVVGHYLPLRRLAAKADANSATTVENRHGNTDRSTRQPTHRPTCQASLRSGIASGPAGRKVPPPRSRSPPPSLRPSRPITSAAVHRVEAPCPCGWCDQREGGAG